MDDWPDLALACLARGEQAVLVTVLATEGSAPREAGTRMLVTADLLLGTIGGGNLEHQATIQARKLLVRPDPHYAVQDYPLGPLLGQCCGGRVRLLLERLDAGSTAWLSGTRDALRGGTDMLLHTRFHADRLTRQVQPGDDGTDPVSFLAGDDIAAAATARGDRPGDGATMLDRPGASRSVLTLCGAGHVGRAIALAFAPLPFHLRWFDTRPDYAAPGGASAMTEAELAGHLRVASADSLVLILTHDHALDYRLVQAALAGEAGFVGLIGSATKRARFLSRLGKEGVDGDRLRRLCCPIGIGALGGKEPSTIAVSVAAQLLQLRAAGFTQTKRPYEIL